jgi:hypothetical protein
MEQQTTYTAPIVSILEKVNPAALQVADERKRKRASSFDLLVQSSVALAMVQEAERASAAAQVKVEIENRDKEDHRTNTKVGDEEKDRDTASEDNATCTSVESSLEGIDPKSHLALEAENSDGGSAILSGSETGLCEAESSRDGNINMKSSPATLLAVDTYYYMSGSDDCGSPSKPRHPTNRPRAATFTCSPTKASAALHLAELSSMKAPPVALFGDDDLEAAKMLAELCSFPSAGVEDFVAGNKKTGTLQRKRSKSVAHVSYNMLVPFSGGSFSRPRWSTDRLIQSLTPSTHIRSYPAGRKSKRQVRSKH